MKIGDTLNPPPPIKVGDTFKSPGGPNARFAKDRKMEVIAVNTVMDETWIDARPVEPKPRDRYWHSTYRLDETGWPMRV